jgi:hypothetical protein
MTEPSLYRRLWFWAALVLTVAQLWLTRGQGVCALGNAGYDDRLFIDLAQHLIAGEWLGPFNELTLAKGPFYPLFIAGAFAAGIPLFLAQHLLYAAACALFTRALRPAIASGWWRLLIFALLLWNPMSFEASSMGRPAGSGRGRLLPDPRGGHLARAERRPAGWRLPVRRGEGFPRPAASRRRPAGARRRRRVPPGAAGVRRKSAALPLVRHERVPLG